MSEAAVPGAPLQPALADAAPAPLRQGTPEPLASEALLQGRQAIEIRHNGSIYRLQATRLGKLILTK